jgi:hypothetical protein
LFYLIEVWSNFSSAVRLYRSLIEFFIGCSTWSKFDRISAFRLLALLCSKSAAEDMGQESCQALCTFKTFLTRHDQTSKGFHLNLISIFSQKVCFHFFGNSGYSFNQKLHPAMYLYICTYLVIMDKFVDYMADKYKRIYFNYMADESKRIHFNHLAFAPD